MARQEIASRPGLDAVLADGASLSIAGARTPLTAFKVRTMNFGQPWRTPGIDDIVFELAVPLQCLAAVLRTLQVDYATVLADPELCRLALANYGHQTLLELENCLAADARAAGLPRWVLNTIVSTAVSDRVGIVRGMARAPVDGDDIKYQDA